MKAKRMIASILSMALATGMLAGCGSSSAASSAAPAASAPAASTAASGAASAAEWKPSKGFKAFIGYGAGGSTDNAMRPLFTAFEKISGQNVTVENTSGGSSSISFADAIESGSDGYSLITTAENLCLFDAYDLIEYGYKDVTPIIVAGSVENCVYVKADSPYQTFEDLVEAEKANPGSVLRTASGTVGVNATNFAAIKQVLGVEFQAYTADSSTSAIVTVLGGFADFGISSMGGLKDYIESGDVRVLCNLDSTRIDPDIPCVTEAYPDLAEYLPVNAFYTISVHKDTDPAIVEYLTKTFKEAWESQEYQDAMAAYGVTTLGLTGQDAVDYIDNWRESAFTVLTKTGVIDQSKMELLKK